MSDDTANIWDRQPDEPLLWYERFERYRLAGPGRSLLAIYQAEKSGPGRGQKVAGAWNSAAEQWRWQQRAEAWDMAELAASQADREAEYRAALEAHRDRSRSLAEKNLNIALKVLELIGARLLTIKADDIPVKLIPTYLRATADVAERSLNAEAHALGLDQLLGSLSNDHEPDQTEP